MSIMVHLEPGEMVVWRADMIHAGTWMYHWATNTLRDHRRVHGAIEQLGGKPLSFPIKNYYKDSNKVPYEQFHQYTKEHQLMFGDELVNQNCYLSRHVSVLACRIIT